MSTTSEAAGSLHRLGWVIQNRSAAQMAAVEPLLVQANVPSFLTDLIPNTPNSPLPALSRADGTQNGNQILAPQQIVISSTDDPDIGWSGNPIYFSDDEPFGED